MSDTLYPSSAGALSDTRKRLAPEVHGAFQTFSQKVFANGALATKTKQLIAVAAGPSGERRHQRRKNFGSYSCWGGVDRTLAKPDHGVVRGRRQRAPPHGTRSLPPAKRDGSREPFRPGFYLIGEP